MWRCTVSVKKTTATSTFLSQRLKNTFQTHLGRLQLKPARSLNNNGVGNRRVILSRFLSLLITAVVAVTNVPHVPSPPSQRRNYRALRTSGKLHGTLTADSRWRVRDWRSHVTQEAISKCTLAFLLPLMQKSFT